LVQAVQAAQALTAQMETYQFLVHIMRLVAGAAAAVDQALREMPKQAVQVEALKLT
jgi:hypothetical protein